MPQRRLLELQEKDVTTIVAKLATVNLSKKYHDVKPQAVSFN